MKPILQSVKEYLKATLKAAVETRRWKNRTALPFFLTDAYDFYETSLLDQPCLLMVSHENTEPTPSSIRKHQQQVQKHWENPIIYVQSTLSSYNRQHLIGQHIPFIIPGNQMYLPDCGIDLREHFRKVHLKKEKGFSPATQTVVIYALMRKTNEKLTSSWLIEKLGYTLMTINRAFNELKAAGIGEFQQDRREHVWTFPSKQGLWEQAKPFLRSPIKKTIWVKSLPLDLTSGKKAKSNSTFYFATSAGLSALSHFSQLSPPTPPVYAIGPQQWKSFKQSTLEEIPSPEDASEQLEIWSYNPKLFAKNGVVDPISLYHSLEATQDARIELCLKEMMESIEW